MLGVLHTWSRTLVYHPHIHYLIPAGALSLDGRQWRRSPKKFLLRVEPLSDRFRNLFAAMLAKSLPQALTQVPAKVWKQRWVTHCQPAGSGKKALQYLSRYIFKTATGDRRLVQRANGTLLWPYRDSATGQPRTLPLAPTELIRRFLQHVLPKGYTRVRSFGWFHPAAKVKLNRVRALLRQKPLLTQAEQQTWQIPNSSQEPQEEPPIQPEAVPPLCPRCRIPMRWMARWQPHEHPPRPPPPPP